MSRLTKQVSINTFWLVSYIFFSSLYLSENLFSNDNWNRNLTKVVYNSAENSIIFSFVVFDYHFGQSYRKAYLKLCDFYFTTDRKSYDHLMRVETKEQKIYGFTEFKMSKKNISAELQFLGCVKPANASFWADSIEDLTVKVKNEKNGIIIHMVNNIKYTVYKYIASFTVKWLLGENFNDVKYIRLNGYWNVIGSGIYSFEDVHYRIPRRVMLKSTVNHSKKTE